MNKKIILLICFGFLILIQIYVPAKMIMDSEKIISEGKVFNFICRPVDPNDIFRGKYITLRFQEDEIEVADDFQISRGTKVYIVPEVGPNGYAKIKTFSLSPPLEEPYYLEAESTYIKRTTSPKRLKIKYPFTRYYMNESKAKPAEKLLGNRMEDDDLPKPYAKISVGKGEARITNVMIDDKALEDWIEEQD